MYLHWFTGNVFWFSYIHSLNYKTAWIRSFRCCVADSNKTRTACRLEVRELSKQCMSLSFTGSSELAAVLKSVLQVAKRNCHYGIYLWDGLAQWLLICTWHLSVALFNLLLSAPASILSDLFNVHSCLKPFHAEVTRNVLRVFKALRAPGPQLLLWIWPLNLKTAKRHFNPLQIIKCRNLCKQWLKYWHLHCNKYTKISQHTQIHHIETPLPHAIRNV